MCRFVKEKYFLVLRYILREFNFYYYLVYNKYRYLYVISCVIYMFKKVVIREIDWYGVIVGVF